MSIHCNFYLVVMGRKKYLALRKGRYRDGGCTSNQPGNDECDRCMCYNLKQMESDCFVNNSQGAIMYI